MMKYVFTFTFLYLNALFLPAQSIGYDFVVTNDGVWTWFNDERAVGKNDRLYTSYVRKNGFVGLAVNDLTSGQNIGQEVTLSTWSQVDDHNNAAILLRQDGKIMTFYTRHNNASNHSYRTSKTNEPITATDWNTQITQNTGASATYNNVFQLSAESGKIYNFMRTRGFNPNWKTFNANGNQLTSDRILIQSGGNQTRPYVKYTSNNVDRIDFFFTDGHPRASNNNLYHFYYKNGNLYQSNSTFLKKLSDAPININEVNKLYTFGSTHPTARPWTHSINYDANLNPVITYSLQVNINNITYHYAKWNPQTATWNHHQVADAGDGLYNAEDDYTGLIVSNPYDINKVIMSTNVDPRNGSTTSKYEIYSGITTNGGQSFSWEALTQNSTADNLRPFIPKGITQNNRVVLWFTGSYNTYTNYTTKIVGKYLNRSLGGGNNTADYKIDINHSNSITSSGFAGLSGNQGSTVTVDGVKFTMSSATQGTRDRGQVDDITRDFAFKDEQNATIDITIEDLPTGNHTFNTWHYDHSYPGTVKVDVLEVGNASSLVTKVASHSIQNSSPTSFKVQVAANTNYIIRTVETGSLNRSRVNGLTITKEIVSQSYAMDVNHSNGISEPGFTGINGINGNTVNISGATFTLFGVQSSRDRSQTSNLTRDFVFSDGPSASLGVRIEGLQPGSYQLNSWQYDHNYSGTVKVEFKEQSQSAGTVLSLSHSIQNASPASATIQVNANTIYELVVTPSSGENRSRFNGMSLIPTNISSRQGIVGETMKKDINEGVTLFPNPFSTDFQIQLPANHRYERAIVLDVLGHVVLSKTIHINQNTLIFNGQHLRRGLYFISLTGSIEANKAIQLYKL